MTKKIDPKKLGDLVVKVLKTTFNNKKIFNNYVYILLKFYINSTDGYIFYT